MLTSKARTRHYIGIDPSLRGTGIAIISIYGNKIIKRTLRIGLSENGPLLLYLQCNQFIQFIEDCIGEDGHYEIRGICIEAASLQSTRRADAAGQVRGAYNLCCMQKFYPPVVPREVPPTSLKKFFAGTGTGTKERMVTAAEEHGWDVESDDEADAAGLAELAYALDDESLLLTRKQLEAIKGINEMGLPTGKAVTNNPITNI